MFEKLVEVWGEWSRDTKVEGNTSGDSGGVSLDEGYSLQGSKGAQEKVGVVVRFASIEVNNGDWDHHCFVLPVGIHRLEDVFFKDFPWVEIRGFWGLLEVLEYQFLGRFVKFPLPVSFLFQNFFDFIVYSFQSGFL